MSANETSMSFYGCHSAVVDRPQPGAFYRVQNGWTTDGRRAMVDVATLPSVTRCYYDQQSSDTRCAHCAHAKANPEVAL